MAGRIPQSFIDDLISRVDIVDVIDHRVPLRKAGVEYKACCPFHGEKTPSFTVSPTKQFYHCFGCGAHGTALGFLMEYESLNFPEAVEELASSVGLQVPREGGDDQPRDDHSRHFQILEQATDWFREQLKADEGRIAVEYLKDRGVSGEIAKTFGMGFAPAGYENLIAHFRGKARSDELKTVGLLAEREDSGRVYDKFRERIIFPIRDRRGRTVGFGGRVLGDGTPKYLNSPETPVFHKGNELYGLYEVLKSAGRPDRLLVVEGYMDVVALAQYGINNAVAALGTASTTSQIQKLFRTVTEVVFCFDGDRAGRQAAWRAMQNALPVLGPSHQARFLFLPDGHDPDSLVREEGPEAFSERMDQAMPMLEYVFRVLEDEDDPVTVEGKARIANKARPLIDSIQDGVLRDLMVERLSKTLELNEIQIEKHLGPKPEPKRQAVTTPTTSIDPSRSPVRMIIALLLAKPTLSETGLEAAELADVQRKGADLMRDLLEICRDNPDLNTASLLERFRGHPAHSALERLAAWDLGFTEESHFQNEYTQTMRRFEVELTQQRIDALLATPRTSLTEDQADELRRLMAARSSH